MAKSFEEDHGVGVMQLEVDELQNSPFHVEDLSQGVGVFGEVCEFCELGGLVLFQLGPYPQSCYPNQL